MKMTASSTDIPSERQDIDSYIDDPLSYLPDPPDKPLPSDCCGTGCTPCVLDIYHEELEMWRKLSVMTPNERADWRRQQLGHKGRNLSVKYGLSTMEFRQLSVKSIKQVSVDSFIYSIALPDSHCLGFQPGQHCILRVVDSFGSSITRQYTPISPPHQEGSFSVLIKLYRDGLVSQAIQHWVVGTVTEWKGLFGGISYKPNKYRQINMLACGTGIAPMFQVIQTIIENEQEDTVINLLYSSHTQHTILLKQKLDHYASYWNFRVLYILSRTSQQDVKANLGLIKYGDRVHYGRLDYELVHQEMPEPVGNSHVLICGTRSFDKDMINHITKIGYTKDMYHKF